MKFNIKLVVCFMIQAIIQQLICVSAQTRISQVEDASLVVIVLLHLELH
jgi:hypothetical protein